MSHEQRVQPYPRAINVKCKECRTFARIGLAMYRGRDFSHSS